jgi:Trk K+ transport system NAD-binding subunit
MVEEVRSFAPLLVVIFMAFAIPMLLTRFRRFMIPADVDQCYRVCDCAIANYGVERVVSLVTEPSAQERFRQLGVITLTVSRDRAALLALLACNPDIYQLLTRTDDTKEVAEVIVRERQHDGVVLRDLSLPGDVVVLRLHRDGEFFVPQADTRLNNGDRLTLIGSFEDIDNARQMLAFVTAERLT